MNHIVDIPRPPGQPPADLNIDIEFELAQPYAGHNDCRGLMAADDGRRPDPRARRTRGQVPDPSDGKDSPYAPGRLRLCPACRGTGLVKAELGSDAADACPTLGELASGSPYPADADPAAAVQVVEDPRAELECGVRAVAERFPAGTTVTMSHRPSLTLWPDGSTNYTDEWCVLVGPPGGAAAWGRGRTTGEAVADAVGNRGAK